VLIETLSDQSGREIIFGDFDIVSEGPKFTDYTQSNLLYQYWTRKGGLEKRISRDHINPGELKPVLKHIVMMDIAPGRSPFMPPETPASAYHDFALQVRLMSPNLFSSSQLQGTAMLSTLAPHITSTSNRDQRTAGPCCERYVAR